MRPNSNMAIRIARRTHQGTQSGSGKGDVIQRF